MNLLISKGSVSRSSNGVKNYFNRIFNSLENFNDLNISLSKNENRIVLSLLHKKKSIIWFPAFYGSILQNKQVITIHDCINITHSKKRSSEIYLYKKYVNNILKSNPYIIAISEFTKDQFLLNYNYNHEKIFVIKSGNDVFNFELNDNNEIIENKYGNYILWITNSLIHKNNTFGVNNFIYSKFNKTDFKLIIIGNILNEDKSLLIRNNINFENLSNIDDKHLINLYKNAFFVYSPTLIEGHNLCIAEALQLNAKVLCSDIPVHKEYFHNTVRYFSPIDLDSSIHILNQALFESDFWNNLDYNNYTRKFFDTAFDYYQIFKKLNRE